MELCLYVLPMKDLMALGGQALLLHRQLAESWSLSNSKTRKIKKGFCLQKISRATIVSKPQFLGAFSNLKTWSNLYQLHWSPVKCVILGCFLKQVL